MSDTRRNPLTEPPQKVGVLVPNGAATLPRCLDSLLAQTSPPHELLVVDGASSDASLDIIQRYAAAHPGIRWISEPDSGPAHAINKGIERTTSPLLTWLNADDALDPSAIESALDAFVHAPGLALVYGSVLNIRSNGSIVEMNHGLTLPASDLAVFDFIPQTGAVFRRYPGLFLDADLQWGFDWHLWFDLAQRGTIRNLDRIQGACIVAGHGPRKSDMLIPRRTLELARLGRRQGGGSDVRVWLAYLAGWVGAALMPLRLIDTGYHAHVIRWTGRLFRLLCGKTEKGIML